MIPTFIKRDDGSVYINPAKRHIRPFWLTSTPNNTITIAAGAIVRGTYLVDTQGHFEILYAMFSSDTVDPDLDINILDTGTRRNLMNRPIRLQNIAGDAQRPFIWPESYFINTENGQREIQVEFTNNSGAPIEVQLIFYGRRFYYNEAPPDVQKKMRERFEKKERTQVYFLNTEEEIILGAGATLTGPGAPRFRATDEADTEILKMTAFPLVGYEFALRELRSNRLLSNGNIAASLGFGTGQFPFNLQEGLLLERNYELRLELTNLTGAPINVDPCLTARRLYY